MIKYIELKTGHHDDGPAWINVVNSDGTGLRRVTPRCTSSLA